MICSSAALAPAPDSVKEHRTKWRPEEDRFYATGGAETLFA
jgi:hypothetical protein